LSYPPQVDDELVAKLTRQGWSAQQIADELNVTTRTVVRSRKRSGILGSPPQWMTDEELAIAERMLDDGASLTEVARTLDRHPTSIWKRFRGRGWTPAQTGQHNALRHLEARLEL